MGKLYKYLKSGLFDLVFPKRSNQVSLKASRPSEFNDPYELFLSIDSTEVSEEILAYYQEIVAGLPKLPTICFAKAPDIVPMWAHYGQESTGFVVEIDEAKLVSELKDPLVENVEYSSTAVVIDAQEVAHAFMTAKPRHTYFIQSTAFRSAYFTKSQYWSYEQERRLVIQGEDLVGKADPVLLRLPLGCVTALLVGPKVDPKFRRKTRAWTKRCGIDYYDLRIGRSSMSPYFLSRDKRTFLFQAGAITPAEIACAECGEPKGDDEGDFCHWCAIEEKLKEMAAFRNPMRRLASLGMLEDYVRGMDKIGSTPAEPQLGPE